MNYTVAQAYSNGDLNNTIDLDVYKALCKELDFKDESGDSFDFDNSILTRGQFAELKERTSKLFTIAEEIKYGLLPDLGIEYYANLIKNTKLKKFYKKVFDVNKDLINDTVRNAILNTNEFHLLIATGRLPDLGMEFYKDLFDDFKFKDGLGNPLNINDEYIMLSIDQFDTIRYSPKLHGKVIDDTIEKLEIESNINSDNKKKILESKKSVRQENREKVISKYDELSEKYFSLLSRLGNESKHKDSISSIIYDIKKKKDEYVESTSRTYDEMDEDVDRSLSTPNVSIINDNNELISKYEDKIKKIKDDLESARSEMMFASKYKEINRIQSKIDKLREKNGHLSNTQIKMTNQYTIDYVKKMDEKFKKSNEDIIKSQERIDKLLNRHSEILDSRDELNQKSDEIDIKIDAIKDDKNTLKEAKEKVFLRARMSKELIALRIQKIVNSGKKVMCNLSEQLCVNLEKKVVIK